ncbi:MAG: hypothetical protein CMI52_00235 [Parcubacteria group bacterium]|nr:hypothetical protein [Parcubacteria group bacterium]|tara:strand:+ start:297 stop:500 length:204 start_codon:yes stop_codon:yes gene_type:complete
MNASTGVILAGMSFMIDNPTAGKIAKRAEDAQKADNWPEMRRLRTIAARVEEGMISEADGLAQANAC